jgi:hypothetical protein
MIIEEREAIKTLLENGFEDVEVVPYFFVTSFPTTVEALTAMQTEAKKYSDKGAIYITWTTERAGIKQAGIYPNFIDVFTVYIFSSDKDSDEDIIRQYEIVRNILYTKYFLYYGEMSPIKSTKTGLFMASISVGTDNIYTGE